jgi:hypothetical protein
VEGSELATIPAYVPEWRANSTAAWCNLAFPLTVADLTAAGMASGKIYQFRFVASSPPTPPTVVKVSGKTKTTLTLVWNASTG